MSRMGAAAVSMLAMSLLACVPWTVRPIEAEKQERGGSSARSRAEYVDAIWDSRLVPAVTNAAVDARVLLNALAASPGEARARYGRGEATGPTYFIVRGEGLVLGVDTRSRVGLALLDIAPFDGRPDVSIQIGPVLRGTSLRDATGVVRFSDFTNQLQFADVGNEINDRVLRSVLAPLDARQLKRRKVLFAGTVAAVEKSQVPLPELVPVLLRLEDGR